MWVFPCAEAAQAHSTLQPPQDPFYAAKSCIGLIYLIFKREAVHGSKQFLLPQGRGDACSCPGYLPVRFHLFQPWGGQGQSWAAPEGWNAQVRRPPWASNPLQLGSHNITRLLAAAEPPAPGHTWIVKWTNTEMCQIGVRALVGPGWSLSPLFQHPARKKCFVCWGGLCSPTSPSAQVITPAHSPAASLFCPNFQSNHEEAVWIPFLVCCLKISCFLGWVQGLLSCIFIQSIQTSSSTWIKFDSAYRTSECLENLNLF